MTQTRAFVVAVVGLTLVVCGFPAESQVLERTTRLTVDLAYYVDDNGGYGVGDGGFAPISYTPEPLPSGYASPTTRDEGRELGSGWGSVELQAVLTHRIKMPFLVGSAPLTTDNSIAFSVAGALTPVSTRLEVTTTVTPIAFFNMSAGTMLGTGWDIGFFNGMGLDADGTGTAESASFQGVVSKTWLGAALQFDLAAVVPGEWTHVVAAVRTKLQYSVFSGADRTEAWMWEGVRHFNGFDLGNTYFLGYQMPLVVDTVGLLLETSRPLGYVRDLSSMSSGGWGSDFTMITVGPLSRFALSETASLTALVQFRRKRLYDETSVFHAYYENRSYAGAYWDLLRVAVSYGIQL